MKTVTLISKDDCSLCDKALLTLEKISKKKPFILDIKKIQPGTSDYDKYKEKIPVIYINNVRVFYYTINEQTLLEML